jgi:hypothetical protein
MNLINEEENEEKDKKELEDGGSWIDKLQLALDGIGLIPGYGEVADLINAIISLVRGNPLEAALSLISIIPVAGDAVGKGGKVVVKILGPAMPAIKAVAGGEDIVKALGKLGPDVLESLAKNSSKIREFKDFIAKYGKSAQEIIDLIKSGNSEKLLKIAGYTSAPTGKVKQIADFALKKAGEKIPDVEQMLADFYKFLSDFTEEKVREAMDSAKSPTKNEKSNEEEPGVKSESFLHERYSIRKFMMSDEMINEALRELERDHRRRSSRGAKHSVHHAFS